MIIVVPQLNKEQRLIFSEETKYSPHIGYIREELWNRLETIYGVVKDERLIGICCVANLGSYKKLGPFIVQRKYQGMGYGKQLLRTVISQVNTVPVFIGSSNPRVCSIVQRLEFQKISGFFQLPGELQRYLLWYYLERFSMAYIIDAIRKIIKYRRGKYYSFLRYTP